MEEMGTGTAGEEELELLRRNWRKRSSPLASEDAEAASPPRMHYIRKAAEDAEAEGRKTISPLDAAVAAPGVRLAVGRSDGALCRPFGCGSIGR